MRRMGADVVKAGRMVQRDVDVLPLETNEPRGILSSSLLDWRESGL